MKRVFVGIPISKEIKERVLIWAQNFEFRISNFESNPKNVIRWIEPKNLHVTLVPPWEVKEWKVESKKLKEIKFEPFEIKFNRICFGPDEQRPRMIWATGKAGEEIGKLKKLIETALVDNTRTYADAKQKSVREFKMHITLARFKNTTLMSPLILRGGDNIDWRMQVSSFVLYQSHLSPVGADYEVLEEFILNSSTKYPSRPGSRAEADES